MNLTLDNGRLCVRDSVDHPGKLAFVPEAVSYGITRLDENEVKTLIEHARQWVADREKLRAMQCPFKNGDIITGGPSGHYYRVVEDLAHTGDFGIELLNTTKNRHAVVDWTAYRLVALANVGF